MEGRVVIPRSNKPRTPLLSCDLVDMYNGSLSPILMPSVVDRRDREDRQDRELVAVSNVYAQRVCAQTRHPFA